MLYRARGARFIAVSGLAYASPPWGRGGECGCGCGARARASWGRRGGALTGASVGGCVARGRRFGRRRGVRWSCAVFAVLVLALVLACLRVWLLYISVCGCDLELSLREA